MTREDRLDEIADYVLFLESLRHKTGWDKNSEIKILYFGFSQGVTTLMRWLQNIAQRADFLLLWAGGFPDDILFDHRRSYFKAIPTHYFLGQNDPYIKQEAVDKKKSLIDSIGFDLSFHSYPGDHRVDDEVLRQWVERYLQ
jgi:predicted esterase